jgi:hypothetical protein
MQAIAADEIAEFHDLVGLVGPHHHLQLRVVQKVGGESIPVGLQTDDGVVGAGASRSPFTLRI